MQIVILGMHRSGTSLTTRLINMMGAYFGPEGLSLGFAEDNPKGFWERRDVLKINQGMFRYFGCTWFKVDKWDDTRLGAMPPPLAHAIQSVILEMDAHRPWVMKDPRLCMTFPCWRPFLEVPVAVIAWRDPLEVARSLQIRNSLPIEYGLALWEYHAAHAIRHAAALPKAFTHYDSMIASPVEATKTLYEDLCKAGVSGLRLPSEREILAFVEPSLYRARRKDTSHALTPHQEKLSSMLRGDVPFDAKIEVSKAARDLMQGAGSAAFSKTAQ